MTATTSVTPIPVDKIDEDVSNHRLLTDEASNQQLVDSIKANGIQQPIKVTPKSNGRFTLVFGFRRKAAAIAAGLQSIPAIVEQDLDINAIRQLQAIENLERRELHPMEEAQFCQDLATTITRSPGKHDAENIAEAVAQRIGRSRKWVELRLSMARLSPRVKTAFMEGRIHLKHAQLIARLINHDAQEEVLGQVQAQDMGWLNGRQREESRQPPRTIADTRGLVEQRLRDLQAAPWKLDATFDGLPACSGCPHNSANRLDLFDGDQPKKPQCLNAECYAQKSKAASRAVVKATNTAIKIAEGKAVVGAAARDAIAQRDVGWIRDSAVLQAAQRRAAPNKPTDAEKRGQQTANLKHQANAVYRAEMRDWCLEIEEAVAERFQPSRGLAPKSLAIATLIGSSDLVNTLEADDEGSDNARAIFIDLLRRMIDPQTEKDSGTLHGISTTLAPYINYIEHGEHIGQAIIRWLTGAYFYACNLHTLACLVEAFDLDVSEMPNLEAIQARVESEQEEAA